MASTIKVDNVQNQPGTNIINKCSTTITIGASSDTVTLACGASQTGFGRTGTVDWQTGDIKTATFTAATGKGYFCNTTGGVLTVNLPAGSAGDIVGLKDYAGTWDSNAITLAPNGSEKIGGDNATDPTIENEGGSLLLVYVDGTQGWLTTQESVTTSPSGAETFITATGGTPCSGAISGDYKIHTFTAPGTFIVTSTATCAPNNVVDYLVVGGGAGGGSDYGAGGGAGGYRESVPSPAAWTGSPLAFAGNARPVTATPYAITVGAGGAGGTGGCDQGTDGSISTFSDISSAGGGGGGSEGGPHGGRDGGSGGGTTYYNTPVTVGAGDVPNVTPDQGFPGGLGWNAGTGGHAAGGGGGAGAVGVAAANAPVAGAGGAGVTSCITATPVQRGGGGGGAGGGSGPQSYTKGAGGAGGGGAGATTCATSSGVAGGCNTGGGGGGGNNPTKIGGNGGSGIVVLRYKFQ